jgi:hypothetical protein
MVDSTDVRSRTAIALHTALTLQPSSRPASIVIKVECFLLDVLLLFPLLRVDNTFRNKKTVQVLLHVYNTRCAFLQNVWKGDKKDRFDSQKQQEMSLLENEQTGCETQQPAFHSAGTEGYPISRVQRPRHEADHLPPFSADVDSDAIPPLPLRHYMACTERSLTLWRWRIALKLDITLPSSSLYRWIVRLSRL